MIKKLDLRVRKTYNALILAYEELCVEKPFDKITVNELCERAAIRRPTFYKHFIDKYDFLNFFIKNKVEDTYKSTLRQLGDEATPGDFFEKLFECMLEDTDNQYQLLLKNTIDSSIIKELTNVRSYGHKLIRDHLKLQVSDQTSNLDYFIFSALSHTITSCIFWRDHQNEIPKDEMIQMYRHKINLLLEDAEV